MPIKVKIVQLGKGVSQCDLDENASVETCLNAIGITGSGMDLHVNGRPIQPGQKLEQGDLITIIPRIKGGKLRRGLTNRPGVLFSFLR